MPGYDLSERVAHSPSEQPMRLECPLHGKHEDQDRSDDQRSVSNDGKEFRIVMQMHEIKRDKPCFDKRKSNEQNDHRSNGHSALRNDHFDNRKYRKRSENFQIRPGMV